MFKFPYSGTSILTDDSNHILVVFTNPIPDALEAYIRCNISVDPNTGEYQVPCHRMGSVIHILRRDIAEYDILPQ